MTKETFLVCPQCGVRNLYVENENKVKVFFNVNGDRKPVPTKQSNANLEGLDFSVIKCCGCSWKGGLNKLVKP